MLFRTRRDKFQQAKLKTYGKQRVVSFLCLDLIWKPIKAKGRFVLVTDGAEKLILIYSDLLLDLVSIITAYGYRFKIEIC